MRRAIRRLLARIRNASRVPTRSPPGEIAPLDPGIVTALEGFKG